MSEERQSLQLSISDIDFDISKLIDGAVATAEPITVLWKSFLSTETAAQAQFSNVLEATTIRVLGRKLSIYSADIF